MTASLFDKSGHRKYLVARERASFVTEALRESAPVARFCLTLAVTGARISEVLALTSDRIDFGNKAIVFETLKQRQEGVFRAVPVPQWLLGMLTVAEINGSSRLWPWCRTTGWKLVKGVMRRADITEDICKPKALRHAFGIEAGQKGIPLNVVQRWLGHARIETTAIYANAIGEEERKLAARSWHTLESVVAAHRDLLRSGKANC